MRHFRSAIAALLLLLSTSVQAQWQTPAGTIPVGRGGGAIGFNSVLGSAGAGAKCLVDTAPPTFVTCPGGAGAVSSVFGRTGVVVATLGDYTFSLVGGTALVNQGGTGATSFTANLPLIGNGTSLITQGTRSGNTTSFATTSGAMTNGNCVSIDANGNLVAAGGACTIGGGSGTVTSVGFTGGLISVGTPTTTPALTVAGTSGGIPYFSSASTWASSAALAANALVTGGGAGAAPATVTTGTGVLTALGVNVGSAGAFVTFNGALGTPSSGTVTNLTGTASININGTVGATTQNTGQFTSLAYSTTLTGTSANANALAIGLNGATNPALNVDASTASSATGIRIKSAAAAAGVALSVISSGTNENLTIDAKGSGTVAIGGTSTGAITLTRATTISAALTYGGVTLANAVTGTGNMALSISPAFTTPTLGAATATTINGNALTAGTWTLTGAASKTLTFNNTLTLAGTDSTTMTFPSVSATIPRTVASGAKALATTAVGSAACSTAQTDTATGTLTTDAIIATFNADPTAVTGYVPLTSGMLTIIAYPTADTANFKVCNNTGSSITPGAVTINWRVVR